MSLTRLPGERIRVFTNAQTGTSYTLGAAAWGLATTFSNSSAVAVTLDSTVGAGFWADIHNLGAGTVTLTPSSGTINGAASFALLSKLGGTVYFDGTNWIVVGLGVSTPSLVAGANVSISGTWPNQTIAATGGGSGGALSLISSVTTTGTQSSVTFSSIGGFTHLELRINGRSTAAGVNNITLRIQFNGDTGTNYQTEDGHSTDTASAVGPQAVNQTSGLLGTIPAATATANYSGTVYALIANYAGTVFFKELAGHYGVTLGTASFNVSAGYTSSAWSSTAAITSVKIFPASGAFVDGSVISIYGVS